MEGGWVGKICNERTTGVNYYRYCADVRRMRKGSGHETSERAYLKGMEAKPCATDEIALSLVCAVAVSVPRRVAQAFD